MKKKAISSEFRPRCEICGDVNAEVHHIITRGAGGTDDPENLIYLCRQHHSLIHSVGRETFLKTWGMEHKLDIAKAWNSIVNQRKKVKKID